ncbi:hypothetical protein ABG768_017505 [Culter alburnus]|uniref:Uncharacterized protein n=1 Tax=Culter alburnus TaxID=194366 RepID=A0AAW1YWP9_CULAL
MTVWNAHVLEGGPLLMSPAHTLLSLCSFIMRVLMIGCWSLTAQPLEELLIIKSSQPLQPSRASRAWLVGKETSPRMQPPLRHGCHTQPPIDQLLNNHY